MICRQRVGLFGGTFDPVHQGHIHMACEAQRQLGFDKVYLLPSSCPPHRDQPQLSPRQRLHLLNLAVADCAGLIVDDREIHRAGPSYTVDTLKSFRDELGEQASISLLMGADAFSHLTQWHQWQQLPQLAHIVVVERPGYSLPDKGILGGWLSLSDSEQIRQQAAGQAVSVALTALDISATAIRQQLSSGLLPATLPKPVAEYIEEYHLYGFHP
ncbi:MAG: nicotinate-nucleotide adenylyltransferase [Cellvibrionaceae bacterium]|nr:nicotinate-nucleotide adenylyltransferase [Cellvibrionaceae bacterium]